MNSDGMLIDSLPFDHTRTSSCRHPDGGLGSKHFYNPDDDDDDDDDDEEGYFVRVPLTDAQKAGMTPEEIQDDEDERDLEFQEWEDYKRDGHGAADEEKRKDVKILCSNRMESNHRLNLPKITFYP